MKAKLGLQSVLVLLLLQAEMENKTVDSAGRTVFVHAIVVFVWLLEIIVAITGNTAILLAFCRDRLLRIPRFYSLFNLALCDLTLSAIIGPIGILDFSISKVPRDPFCPIVMFLAYILTTESVLTVLLISGDRYWLTKNPFGYIAGMTGRKMRISIGITWTFSICAGVIFVLLFPYIEQVKVDKNAENFCYTPYEHSKYAVHIMSVEYGLPLICILLLNVLIYKSITKEAEVIRKISEEPSVSERFSVNQPTPTKTKRRTFSQVLNASFVSANESANSTQHSSALHPTEVIAGPAHKTLTTNTSLSHPITVSLKQPFIKQRSWPLSVSDSENPIERPSHLRRSSSESESLNHKCKIKLKTLTNRRPTVPYPQNVPVKSVRRRTVRIKKQRIAKALFLLVLVYIVCWSPYAAGTIYNNICNNCVSDTVMIIFVLLSYLYPALNPLLYAVAHQRFARNFRIMYGNLKTKLSNLC